MAYTTIDKPSDYFETKLYTGNDGTLSVTGLDFQPDFSWLKCRGVAYNHRLYDVIRTPLDSLQSNSTAAESADGDGLSAFNSDGFTVTQGGNTEYNNNAVTYASWNWLANGSGSLNEVGSIDSTVSANTTSGFSIVKWVGTGTGTPTIGHGLGSTPTMIIAKTLDGASTNWVCYHKSLGANGILSLNTTAAQQTVTGYWGTPNTTTFGTLGAYDNNISGHNYIAYCFAEKQGYSKFGSYIGNGNADGTFVYLGFKPAYVMYKPSSAADNWEIHDNKRDTFNPMDTLLYANLTNAESSPGGTTDRLDFLSNGFKILDSGGHINASGTTYIYMAFAENPFVTSSGVPACAR